MSYLHDLSPCLLVQILKKSDFLMNAILKEQNKTLWSLVWDLNRKRMEKWSEFLGKKSAVAW